MYKFIKKYLNIIFSIVKKNKAVILTILIIGITADIFFIKKTYDSVIFSVLSLGIISVIIYRLSSVLVFKFCLLLLGLTFASFLFSGTSKITEKSAVWWVLLIAVGIIRQWIELSIQDRHDNIRLENNIFLYIFKKIASIIYPILGPVRSFKLADSPMGKLLTRLFIRQNNKKILFKTKYDFLMSINSYEYLMSGYFFMGETNPYETKYLRKSLKSGDSFIDIGAHNGWYALNAAQVVGQKGKVIVFEPNPACIQACKENIKLNAFSHIELETLALADKTGIFDFWVGDDMGGSFIQQNTERLTVNKKLKKIKVKTISLDEYHRKNKINGLKLIKIDVEGAEMQVLQGAKNILKQLGPDLIVEVIDEVLEKNNSSERELLKFLSEFGYSPYVFVSSGLIPYKPGYTLETVNMYFSKKKINE